MENSTSNSINIDDNTHPKPTDDIQLDIETVTPDTEKEGTPNDQKNNHKAEKSHATSGSTEDEHEPTDDKPEPAEDKPEAQENSEEKSPESPDEEIETTSP